MFKHDWTFYLPGIPVLAAAARDLRCQLPAGGCGLLVHVQIQIAFLIPLPGWHCAGRGFPMEVAARQNLT